MTRKITTALVCAALAGCLGETRRPGDKPTNAVRASAAPTAERPTVNEDTLREFGFVLYWDSFIRDEVLTALTIEGDFEQGFGKPQLYAYTESNRLYQIDLHSGMVNWLYDVGRPINFPQGRWITEWAYKPEIATDESGQAFKRYDEVFFVARDHLYALDKDNGAELWSVRLPFGASSPAQACQSHVLVGGWDDRIYAFSKQDPTIPDWSWRTDGDVIARPVGESPSMFVASVDGKLHTFDAAGGTYQWSFKTEKRIVQDPLVFKKLLYLPGDDYNVYVLNALDGLLEYRFGAGAPITGRPVAIDNAGEGDTIFFTAGDEGLFALGRAGRPKGSRKTQHDLLWQRKEAERVVCRGARDVYVLDRTGNSDKVKITRLGAIDGKVKGSLELEGVDWVLTNPCGPNSTIREQSLLGGIIVVGYKSGWVAALKEIATLPGGIEAN